MRSVNAQLIALAALAFTSFGVVSVDVRISCHGPIPNTYYVTENAFNPNINLEFEEGPVSDAVRSNPDGFEICIQWGDDFEPSCSRLDPEAMGTLPALDPKTTATHGAYIFRSWIQPTEGGGGRTPNSPISSAEIRSATLLEVPFGIGAPVDDEDEASSPTPKEGTPPTVAADDGTPEYLLGVHYAHDAHVAVVDAKTGQPVFVLELERLFSVRYLDTTAYNERGDLRQQLSEKWDRAADELEYSMRSILAAKADEAASNSPSSSSSSSSSSSFSSSSLSSSSLSTAPSDTIDTSIDTPPPPLPFHVRFVVFDTVHESLLLNRLSMDMVAESLKRFCTNKGSEGCTLVAVDHHKAHASLGLYDAHHELGMRRPLILSYDGGGNDGYTAVYQGDVDATQSTTTTNTASISISSAPEKVAAAAAAAETTTTTGGEQKPLATKPLELLRPRSEDEVCWGSSYAGVGASLAEVLRRSVLVNEEVEDGGSGGNTGDMVDGRGRNCGQGRGRGLSQPSRRYRSVRRQCMSEIGNHWFALSGKLMGYAALGTVRPELVHTIRRHVIEERSSAAARDRNCFTLDLPRVLLLANSNVTSSASPSDFFSSDSASVEHSGLNLENSGVFALGGHRSLVGASKTIDNDNNDGDDQYQRGGVAVLSSPTRQEQRDVAASVQQVMEDDIVAMLRSYLVRAEEKEGRAPEGVDGIVLVGGCALNVRVNSKVAAAFPNLPVHVPAAPSDCGIGIGSAWLVRPPPPLVPLPLPVTPDQHRGKGSSSLVAPFSPAAAALPRAPLGLQFLGPELFDVLSAHDEQRYFSHLSSSLSPSSFGDEEKDKVEVGLDPKRQRVVFRWKKKKHDNDVAVDSGSVPLHVPGRVPLELVAEALGATRLFHTRSSSNSRPKQTTSPTLMEEECQQQQQQDEEEEDGTAAVTTCSTREKDDDQEEEDLKGFDVLAGLLMDENIIGVVRGRSEHGPRALGHRSLLSAPVKGMKERLNALKHREWYRPVAPVLLAEDADRCFFRDSNAENDDGSGGGGDSGGGSGSGGRPLHSPFMSFAPLVKPAAATALPAIAHMDASARPQTVQGPEPVAVSGKGDQGGGSSSSDPWMFGLLSAVKASSGWGVLINTSFNTRGRPILNTASEALELLRSCPELDFVLIEDWLFDKSSVEGLAALGY